MPNDIKIANMLEILNGNIIMVPGCEPSSGFTSPTLAANMTCKAPAINLETALEVIPGAEIVRFSTGRKFLVLPNGPPPSKSRCDRLADGNGKVECTPDWYQILKDNADAGVKESTEETTPADVCAAFTLKDLN